jgi:hypothetical protein
MPFEPRNLKAYVCWHVFRRERAILLVVHEDRDWMFMCGAAGHGPKECHVVGVGHLTDDDPALHACADLP